MKVELRDGKELFFDGYVNAVERDSRVIHENGRVFVEQIRSGAWADALEKNPNVYLLFNHEAGRVLGQNGVNIRLYEDNIGLRIEGSTTDGEVVEAAKNHQLQGFSFGFRALKDNYEPVKEGLERRYVDELSLKEVSMLSVLPAYYGTQIYTRDEDTVVVSVRYAEDAQNELAKPDNRSSVEPAVLNDSPDTPVPKSEPEPDYSAEYDRYEYI